MKKLSKEEIQNYEHTLTVGKLKEFIEEYNLPDDAKVLIQRVEDKYYESGWGVHLKAGYDAYKNDGGEYVEESLDQYHPAWSCVKYEDDDLLFIDLHY